MRGCLVQISPLDPATGTRVVIRAGGALNAATLRADGLQWFSAVSKLPKISLDFFDISYNGAVQAAKASLELNITRMYGLNRDYLNSLVWEGSPISIWSGDGRSTAAMPLEFVGVVTQGTVDRNSGSLPLQCEVHKKLVDVPFLNVEFGGGGGYDGDPEVRGQLRPACFGSPINVPVFFFDQINWIGQVDGYGNTVSIATLYEDAASFGAKQADYASYAALAAAVIPEGSWATCIAQGLVRLGANPQGVITTDPVCGFGTPGAMMNRWLSAHAGISAGNINTASFTALDTLLTTLLGHAPAVSYYTQTQVQVTDRMQAMCAACNATWFIGPDGKVAVSRAISSDAPALTLKRIGGRPLVTDWRSLDAPAPWWRLKAEAAKTWRVHALNEIDYEDDLKDMGNYQAGETYRQGMIVYKPSDGTRYIYINAAPSSGHSPPNAVYWNVYQDPVDADVVHYLDGTPIEDLKPAAPGADVTGDNTAAAIDGQGDLATQDDVDFDTQVTGPKPETNATNSDNILPNAGLATDTASWTLTNAARVAGAAGDPATFFFKQAAAAALMSITTSLAPPTPIPDGTDFWFSGQVNTTAGFVTNKQFQIFVTWYDATGAYIIGAGAPAKTITLTAAGWTAFSVKATKPANAAAYVLQVVSPASGTALGMVAGMRFARTESAATLGADVNSNVGDSFGGTYATVPRNEIRTPLGTAAAIAGQGALATQNTANLDSQVVDGSTYKRVNASETTAGVLKLAIAGSGARLGDLRNIPAVLAAGIGNAFDGAVSYSATYGPAGTIGTATGTFSVTAGVYHIGNASVSLSAMSAAITGTNDEIVKWQLYIVNPTFVGGTFTLHATRSLYDIVDSDDRMWIGSATMAFPSYGGSSSGPGDSAGGGGGHNFDDPLN